MRTLRQAPLYPAAHALCTWLELHRIGATDPTFCADLCALSRELLCRISAALSFPDTRQEHARRADETLLQLRVLTRVGQDTRMLSTSASRHLHACMEPIGRMLGGWRRQIARTTTTTQPRNKAMDHALPASSAAAASGTTPTTAGLPTATGTIPTTTTTTRASGLSASASAPNPRRRRSPSRAGPLPAARVGGYVRYVDDMFVFGDRREDLRRWRLLVGQRLREELDLQLKHPDAPVLACAGHLDALGYRVRRSHLEPLPKTWRRLRRRLADWVHARGRMRSTGQLRRSLVSAAGHWNFG